MFSSSLIRNSGSEPSLRPSRTGVCHAQYPKEGNCSLRADIQLRLSLSRHYRSLPATTCWLDCMQPIARDRMTASSQRRRLIPAVLCTPTTTSSVLPFSLQLPHESKIMIDYSVTLERAVRHPSRHLRRPEWCESNHSISYACPPVETKVLAQ